MSIEKYEVMQEFLRIAEEQDLLKIAAPEKNPRGEDDKTIKDKKPKSVEKSIIEEAHPNPVYVAEARGDGGLVENAVETQKKIIEMLNKMPTGSLVGRYASVAFQLVKVADMCDSEDQTDAADILMDAASSLFDKITSDDESIPFEEAPTDQ